MKKEEKIRICFVIDNLSRAGTEIQLLLLLQSLDRNKVEPYLCLLNGESSNSRALEPVNLPVLRLHLVRLISFSTVLPVFRFLRFLRMNKIKIVQTFFPDSTRFAAPIAKLVGCLVLGSRRNVGHWMTDRDRLLARIYNRSFIDLMVVNCKAVQRAVIAQEDADVKDVTVVFNAINIIPFKGGEEWTPPDPGGIWKIGMVGNLRKVKGVDIFIKAARLVCEEYPTSQFVVAGGGDKENYQRLVNELELTEHVFFLGSIDTVPTFLSTLAVAVLPSRAEGLSGALLEYMAAGRPIVATRVGGNPELIVHEENGLLVEADDERALADAIIRYCRNTQFARSCSRAARKDANSKYSPDVLADTYTQMLYRISDNARCG